MGETTGREQPFSIITDRNGASVSIEDGGVSRDGRVWGTYIHGIFDNDELRAIFLNGLRVERGIPVKGIITFNDKKGNCIRGVSEVVRKSVDIQRFYDIIGLKNLAY